MESIPSGCGAYGQESNYTSLDRYPAIFSAVRRYFRLNRPASSGRPRILSYGCSTGEECFSLRKYFPEAEIHGCDINPAVLAIARRRSPGNHASFFHPSPEEMSRRGPFDVVFSLSSLCLYPEANAEHTKNPFSYSRFAENAEMLDENLKTNGLLVIYNANYNFLSLEVSRNYNTVLPDTIFENGNVNKHHEDSTPFTITLVNHASSCPRMVSPPRNYRDIDFRHCIYHKTGDGGGFREFMASPLLCPDFEVLSKYVVSDDDLFQGDGLLKTVTRVECVRTQSGLYEKYDVERVSIERPGLYVPVASFVRASIL